MPQRVMNHARLERTKFEQQHPELGLTPAAAGAYDDGDNASGQNGCACLANCCATTGFMPNVATQAQDHALPSGTIYLSPDGKKRRKP